MRLPLIPLLMLLLSAALYAQPAGRGAEARYDSLAAVARSGDTTVDFGALRMAYAALPRYNGYLEVDSLPLHNHIKELIDAKAYDSVLIYTDRILATNYTDVTAHLARVVTFTKLGKADGAAFHQAIARNLVGSILRSGDGAAPGSAYVVISTFEEFITLGFLGLRSEKQEFVERGGHIYDKMSVVDVKTSKARDVYFNVDHFFVSTPQGPQRKK